MKRSGANRQRSENQQQRRADEPAARAADVRAKLTFAELFGPRQWSCVDAGSPADRQEILLRMSMACSMFYGAALQVGCHAFIEFAGLMQTFIDSCKAAESDDREWVHANVHGRNHLPLVEHQVAYLREKLECIYGATFDIVPREPKRTATAVTSGSHPRPRRKRRTAPDRAARA